MYSETAAFPCVTRPLVRMPSAFENVYSSVKLKWLRWLASRAWSPW